MPENLLCGPIEMLVYFDEGADEIAVSDTSTPMQYEKDGAARTFHFQSDDASYIGTVKKYRVRTRLADWPSNFKDSLGDITFESSCDKPASFTAVAQDNVGPVDYKDAPEVW